ncbi:hypothetical protein [Spongiactinospora sp. 9N601]|uniref:hypothetical protein n=1 Tax=Spongiactinospora sp. 9N601 TaxID=3375149 RepID=UPI00378E6FD3
MPSAIGLASSYTTLGEVRHDDPPYGKELRSIFDDDPKPKFNKYYNLGAITWH